MKLDFGVFHDPIEIDVGTGEPAKFHVRWMTATERMRAVQLFNGNSLDQCMEFVFGMIQKVESFEIGGRALDITRTYQVPGTGDDVPMINVALGRIPFAKQVELFGSIFAVNGVSYGPIKMMLGEFLDPADLARVEKLLLPLTKAARSSPPESLAS